MSAGTTYSRTGGDALLVGAWEFAASLSDISPGDLLTSAERLSYHDATRQEQDRLHQLAVDPLTAVPEFLYGPNGDPTCGLDTSAAVESCPAVEQARLESVSAAEAAAVLGIGLDQLACVLTRFAGSVTVTNLPAGTTLYRPVCLLSESRSYGAAMTPLLGHIWYPFSPVSCERESDWHAQMASFLWHPLYGYIEIVLGLPMTVLMGAAGAWPVLQVKGGWWPGGGMQFYFPWVFDTSLISEVEGRSPADIIKKAQFGSDQ